MIKLTRPLTSRHARHHHIQAFQLLTENRFNLENKRPINRILALWAYFYCASPIWMQDRINVIIEFLISL